MFISTSESGLRRLNRTLIGLQVLHALAHLLKALVVWCLLAISIRGRFGWGTVNVIAAASFLVFILREFPTRRSALRALEKIRPDSDYRFTTFDECARIPERPSGLAWETLCGQTAELLSRPTPYLSMPGFAFPFRAFAAAVSFTLIWTMVASEPAADREITHLPSLLRIKLPPGPIRAGSDVRVQVYSEGRMSLPSLQVSPADDAGGMPAAAEPAVVALRVTSAGLYETQLDHVARSLKIMAVADVSGGKHISSPEAHLRVIRPPVLAFVSALVVPPAYSNLQAEELRSAGKHISVLPGTELTLRLESDLPLAAASSRYESDRRTPLKTDWRLNAIEVKGEFRSAGILKISATAQNGLSGDSPFTYDIDTVTDRPPTVSWILPQETVLDAPVEGLVPMRWNVEDDFGLSDFHVIVKTSDGETRQLQAPFLHERRQAVSYLLEITPYLSFAGSEIEVKGEAADNDAVGGFKLGRSSSVRIRAPTVMDMYKNLTEQGGEVSRVMERLSGESTKLLKKMTAAARTLKAEGKMAWQMEQELVSMAESAQQAKQEAEKALSELGRRTESAAKQNLLSRETLQKLSSIGAMMSNLLKDDYIRAQRELQRSLGSVQIDEKQRSMMSAKFNFEQFVQQVDRTHRMLERMTDLMAQAEAQKAVQDLAARAEKAMSENNAERLQSLSQEAATLMPKLQELAKDPAFSELKKALMGASADLPKQLEQTAKAVREASKSSSADADAQRQAAEEKLKKALNELQTALQNGSRQSESKEKENAADKIHSLIDSLIFSLGEMQASCDYFQTARLQRVPEEYSKRLQKAAAVEPILIRASADVSATAERLILFDPRPIQWLTRAIATLHSLSENDEDPSALSARLKMSYRYTATAALQLLEFSQDLQKQGGGKNKGMPMQDLADLLQQMISAQSSLNSKTQMSLQMGMFGESLEQLAFQQELIRRSMEAEAGRFSELQDKLGRIDQLLQDMHKTEEDLRKIGPTPDVQERQQKIMNKLMEMQHSMTEKDEKEEKFEAEPFFGKPTDTSVLKVDRPRINEKEFLRGLPPEYREAGKKYLRALLGAEPQ